MPSLCRREREALSELAVLYYHHFLLSSPVVLELAVASTSLGAGDAFLVLLSSVLLQLYGLTSCASYLLTLCAVLEHALTLCPQSFEAALLAIRVYCHPALQAPSRAAALFASLSIKQVQLVSLSHLLLPDLLRCASLTSAAQLLQQLLAGACELEKEEGELVQLAYQQRRWARVLEIEETAQRLRGRSFVLVSAREDKRWIDLLRAASKDLATLSSLLAAQDDERNKEGQLLPTEQLHVNSDYSVVPCYDPPSSPLHALLIDRRRPCSRRSGRCPRPLQSARTVLIPWTASTRRSCDCGAWWCSAVRSDEGRRRCAAVADGGSEGAAG